jgi:hypothetical protein
MILSRLPGEIQRRSMKTKPIHFVLTAVLLSLTAFTGRADDITAVQSGNWSDPNTWNSGTVPGANDDADIPSGINVIVDTNVAIQFIYDSGTVTMGTNATLDILTDAAIDVATTLDATAPGNTVIYSANAYDAKPQDYYNLVFDGLGTFYNGATPNYGAVNMNIAGDLTLSGTASIQAGADITIGGNLTIGTTNVATSLDCSVAAVVVKGDTVVSGFLMDLDGSLVNPGGEAETNHFWGNVTINPGGTWNVSDVTTWAVGGSFTNNGTIKSKGYGSITFNGAGSIAGKPFQIKTISINGTYAIGATITLTTNTPTLNGTLIFDLANTNQMILPAYVGTAFYYDGNLQVINSGAAPASGASFAFFNSPNGYGGAFASTSLPGLPVGLSWVDNLAASGSVTVIGGSPGSPILTLSQNGGQLTLSWDSSTYPGFRVEAQTNSAGLGASWSDAGSGTISPFNFTINPAGPSVFFRLVNP